VCVLLRALHDDLDHPAMKKRVHSPRASRARPAPRRTPCAPRSSAARRARALALPAECTLAHAEALKARLAALLQIANRVTIDVAPVRRIDTASLQLLAAFAHGRRTSKLDLAISGDSTVFAQAARLLGLAEIFYPDSSAAPREA
jgi:anti-anti-sigma regulatory factor